MNDEPNNIILDYLRDLRDGQKRVENSIRDMQAQMHSMRHNQIAHSTENLRQEERIAELEDRLEKLEKDKHFPDKH